MMRLLAIAIGLLAPLLANAANLALPPQALGASLQELARQSGIQIIFFSKVVAGREAPAVNGTFTPEAALDHLLAGTDLTWHALNDRTIEVAVRPQVAVVPWAPLAQPKPAPEANSAPDAPIAEVEITAERADLSVMRAEIARLESQFYARYNQANTDRRYDVVLCRDLKFTGSHLDRRLCEPAAVVRSRTQAPWLTAQNPSVLDDGPVSIKTPTDPAELRAYQQNMVAVVSKHPELLELVKQRSALVERYRVAREEKIRAREVHQPAVARPAFVPGR
jgi:secretin/TonB-like protein